MSAALWTPRRRQLASLSIAGLGLILAGAAFWKLLTETRPAHDSQSIDFDAVPISVNIAAPELTLRDMEGAAHALSDYLGDVILVNLWATWCPPCKAEMPAFQRFYEEQRGKGFVVIAINDGESEREVRSFVTNHALTFPVWLDPEFRASEGAFKAGNLPTSYVIDRFGTIRLMWIGAISEAGLRKHVVPLIKE